MVIFPHCYLAKEIVFLILRGCIACGKRVGKWAVGSSQTPSLRPFGQLAGDSSGKQENWSAFDLTNKLIDFDFLFKHLIVLESHSIQYSIENQTQIIISNIGALYLRPPGDPSIPSIHPIHL